MQLSDGQISTNRRGPGRIDNFFQFNDERFKNLLLEHREFQRLQRQNKSSNGAERSHLTNTVCKTVETYRTDSFSSEPPPAQVSVIKRNLPTPKYYIPKRLPAKPSDLRKRHFADQTSPSEIITIKSSPRTSPRSSFTIASTSSPSPRSPINSPPLAPRRAQQSPSPYHSPIFNRQQVVSPQTVEASPQSLSPQSQPHKQLPSSPLKQPSLPLKQPNSPLASPPLSPSSPRNIFFNNVFGIRALERRIEEEIREETKRRRQQIRRSISLDNAPEQAPGAKPRLAASASFNGGSVGGIKSREVLLEKEVKPGEVGRPPLKRQRTISEEEDDEMVTVSDPEPEVSSSPVVDPEVSSSPDDRPSLVTFNDVVDYHSISVEEEPECEEVVTEESEQLSDVKSEDPKSSSTRRQRLKDTTWRKVCNDSQEYDVNKALSSSSHAATKNYSEISDIQENYEGEAEKKLENTENESETARSVVQRTRPGQVKRKKMLSSDNTIDKVSEETTLKSDQYLTNLSDTHQSSTGTGSSPGFSSNVEMSTTTSASSSTSNHKSAYSDPTDSCSKPDYFNFDKQDTIKLGTHSIRILAPTSSEDHSSDEKLNGATPNKEPNVGANEPEETRSEKSKHRKVRRIPFNIARVSTDSVDEVFTPRLKFIEGENCKNKRKLNKEKPGEGSSSAPRLGNQTHRITIESPTSSEEETHGSTVTDEDYTTKSSLSEPDDAKQKIAAISGSCEWLTDNEGYYEDSLDIDKLEDKYNIKREEVMVQFYGANYNSREPGPASKLKFSHSFNEGGGTSPEHLVRTGSLKKFNSEGDICDVKNAMNNSQRVKLTILELYETEKNFISNLMTIMEIFAEPLKESGFLPKKAHSVIFPCQLIRLIFKHSVLLGKLEERIHNWKWKHIQKVGDLFTVFKEDNDEGLFKVYLGYITHFPLLFEKLSKTSSTNERFRQFIQKCRREVPACQRLSLLSLLYNPIQRLPQYTMLLKTYLKHLSPDHCDVVLVRCAVSSLQTLLLMANKLCNFQKEGPGTIKLPNLQKQDSIDPSSSSNSSDRVNRLNSDQWYSQPTTTTSPSPTVTSDHRKHNKRLSTLFHVLTFSNVIKKKKKEREAKRNSKEVGVGRFFNSD